MTERPFEELWVDQHRGQLQRRYGAGTYVAVYDRAVIDWGADRDVVRNRATQLVGDDVFVSPVPLEPPNDVLTREDYDLLRSDYDRYVTAEEMNPDRRRYPLDGEAFDAIGRLDITGTKTEFADSQVLVDGVERRFSEHDHRLMIEHGLVPKETELIAGIIFRRRIDGPTL